MHDLVFTTLAPERSQSLKGTFAPHLEQLAPHPEAPLRAALTPFYPGYSLYAVPLAEGALPRTAHLLHGVREEGDDVVVLNWTNEPLYALNERAPVSLRPGTLVSYAKFFFHFVRGQLGAFNIVEKVADVAWLPEASTASKAAVELLLMPVTSHGLEANNLFRLTATVLFKTALFKTDILIAPFGMHVYNEEAGAEEWFTMGQMALANEDLLLDELPVHSDFHEELAD